MLHARYWTTTYPTIALLPMAALVETVNRRDFSRVSVPALFYYSKNDLVVDPVQTKSFVKGWGGSKTVLHPKLSEKDDKYAHVIAGDIVSAHQTDFAVDGILHWLEAQQGWPISGR